MLFVWEIYSTCGTFAHLLWSGVA